MDFIPSGIIADLKKLQGDAMPELSTNSRTGLTHPCRLKRDRREQQLEGMPPFMRLRRWAISFPDGEDVKPADIETITGKGAYTVISTGNPTSYSTSTDVYAVMTAVGDNPPLPTDQVQFEQQGTGELHPAGSGLTWVTICPVSRQAQANAGGFSFTYEAIYPDFAFTNGLKLRQNDLLHWSKLRQKFTQLHYPQRWTLPGLGVALFNDSN